MPTDPNEAVLGRVSDWLACPNCRAAMALDGRVLACSNGHRFDVARQGYVNLLGRSAPANADTPAMLAARDLFLASGHYRPILDAALDLLPPAAERILEVGAGTGWYLAGALDVRERALGLATDVSPAAARRAARAHPRGASIVADTWAGLPLQDAAVDAVLCVFAPRNAAEFARILAPGGSLVVAVPGPDHLAELRQAHGLLNVDDDKLTTLTKTLSADFQPVDATGVRRALDLTVEQATTLVSMGPNAFHSPPTEIPATTATLDVTVASFHKR